MSQNVFGGKNANSIYVPMTEIEQEALSRMIETGDLQVNLVGWGVINKPKITFGDARIQITSTITFNRPETPMDVYYFDMELVTGSGQVIYKDRKATMYDNKPIAIQTGTTLTLIWDIMVKALDKKFVRQWVPSAIGITSRLMDRDTGALTLTGNMRVRPQELALLQKLARGERQSRQLAHEKLVQAVKKQGF